MPHLLAGFEELYEFSRLPNLQELTLGLGLEEDDLDDDFFKRPIGSSSLRTLRVFADTYLRIAPNTAAKALLHCWPNLEVLFHIGADDPARHDNPNGSRSHIDAINRELQQLRALRVVQGRERGESSRKRGRVET
ncbi:hypothetical protein FS749_014468 [Ceratobasidium sp. UAMH 11750]|nr:hypothetical protein FS749_014468 [Ceratobasidium sp. UAMH 11750]